MSAPILRVALVFAAVVGLGTPLLLAGEARGGADGADRSLAIYPRQSIPLRFSHEQHLSAGATCDACHAVDTSRAASDLNLPKKPDCEACHDIAAAQAGEKTDPPSDCQTCHPGFDATVSARPKDWVFPTPNLTFNHQVHVARNIPCATCHGPMEKVGLATREQLPKMETCLSCHHAGGSADGACTTCHLADADGRVEELLPGGARLVPEAGNPFGIAHGPRYEREHGLQAITHRDLCASCHSEAECLACHDGAVKNLKFHPNDWLTLHPVSAKHGALACSSCHNQQQFCATCHERSGLGPTADATLRPASLRVHPPRAVWIDQKGPQHHGVWASRDLQSCVACHREESCLQCHATTGRQGSGYSPHPKGFEAQACNLYRKNARVCLKCHGPGDPELQECR